MYYAKEIHWGEEIVQQMVAERLDIYVAKKNVNTYNHGDNFEMDHQPKCKIWNYNLSKENLGKSL